jgi:hypothetical protein
MRGFRPCRSDTLEAAMIDGASRWERIRYVVIPHLMPLAVFITLMQLMDNFRVFEPIVGFQAQASATSLSYIIFNDLRGGHALFGSAAATSMLTIIGVAILLTPVLRAHLARLQPQEGLRPMRAIPPKAQSRPPLVGPLDGLRDPLADPRGLPLPLDALGLVQGAGRFLQPRRLAQRALRGHLHAGRDRRALHRTGLFRRLGAGGVLARRLNTMIVVVCTVVISLTSARWAATRWRGRASAMPSGF